MKQEARLTGMVLKRQSLSEADLLVTWFTKERGKIRTWASGAARSGSRLAFGLNPGIEAEMRVVGKSSALSYRLIGVSPKQVFLPKPDEVKSLLFFWLMEVIYRSLPDEEPNPDLYVLFLNSLETLADDKFTAEKAGLWQFMFGTRIVASLGWPIILPGTDRGIQPVKDVSNYFFPQDVWSRLSLVEQKRAQVVLALEVGDFYKMEGIPEQDKVLTGFLGEYLQYHLDRSIRSQKVWDAIMD